MSAVRRRRQVLAGVATIVLGLAALLVAAHRLGPRHLLVVEPDVLYRSATLAPAQLARVVERYGIRTVVNLRSERENGLGDWHGAEAAVLAEQNVRLLDLPMHSGFPPSDAVLAEWLATLEDEVAHPILVHCEYGVIRTGMMVAVYEMTHRGRTSEQSLSDFELFSSSLEEPIKGRVETFVTAYGATLAAGSSGDDGT